MNYFEIVRDFFTYYVCPKSRVCSSVTKISHKIYKVSVFLPDRTVSFQFQKPRGPRLTPHRSRELAAYFDNDGVTPIQIIPPASIIKKL
jgi:hypothetical protein